jgi:hypothetical protein
MTEKEAAGEKDRTTEGHGPIAGASPSKRAHNEGDSPFDGAFPALGRETRV